MALAGRCQAITGGLLADKSGPRARPADTPQAGPARNADEAVARMAAVLETMDAAVVGTGPDGTIRSWNRGAEKVFGYEPQDVIGKPLRVLAPPEYAEELQQLHDRMVAGESVTDYETLRIRKDGMPVYVSITQSPYRDPSGQIAGYSVIAQDMTERIRVEEALVRGGERYRELIEDLPLATLRVSTEGLVLGANPACTGLLGTAGADEIANRHASEFFSEPRAIAKMLGRIKDEGRVRGVQLEMHREDGQGIHVLASGHNIIDDYGKPRGYLIMLEDISERVTRERATQQLSALQEVVIRILGHDLKAPIAVIQGHLEIAQLELTRGPLDKDRLEGVQKRLRRVGEASASMLVTLANARAISRLTMGEDDSTQPELVDLARIVKETATILRPLAEARTQQLRVECPEELRVELPPGFESVVGNLLTNAIKYTPKAGAIDVRLKVAGGRAVLEVVDTGPGIPEAMRPRLFRKFERLSEEQTVGSHGLGLSIAYSVAQLAGGTITVEGRPDGASGALFRVVVPVGGAGPGTGNDK